MKNLIRKVLKEESKKKTQRLNENQMSMEDFNLVGDVLRDKNKVKKIHNLLLQMFPEYEEALEKQYKNDSYAEFKEFIFNIDKYGLEGPKLVKLTEKNIDPEVYEIRNDHYEKYINGKIKKYFRKSKKDPRKVNFSKLPPITIDTNGIVVDGNHRAFLAIQNNKTLYAHRIVKANHGKENKERAEDILNIIGRKNIVNEKLN